MDKENGQRPPIVGQFGLTMEGLAWAATLAQYGFSVLCSDPDEEIIKGIQDQVFPGVCFGLEDLVNRQLGKNLALVETPRKLFKSCDLFFVDALMPQMEPGVPSLRFIEPLVRQIAYQRDEDTVVVVRTLMPPETFEQLKMQIHRICEEREEPVKLTLCLMPCLSDGDLLRSMAQSMPLVVGCDGSVPELLLNVLNDLPNAKRRIKVCLPAEAALMAYGQNGAQVLLQTYWEGMMALSRKCDASPSVVLDGLSLINQKTDYSQMNVGAGAGGTALMWNHQALMALSRKMGMPLPLAEAAVQSGNRQAIHLLSRLCSEIKPAGKIIAVLGLAPISDTDDLRETPAVDIVSGLLQRGAVVRLFMPCGLDQAKWRFYRSGGSISYYAQAKVACEGADVVLILGKWKDMNRIWTKSLVKKLKSKVVYDIVCGCVPQKLQKLGIILKY